VLPVLLTVTNCVVLVVPTLTVPKFSDAGASIWSGSGPPIPVRGTEFGEPGALLEMLNVPVLRPAVGGVNFTLKVHVPPGTIAVGLQVPVPAEAKFPVILVEVMLRFASPRFATVT
jgi:hypothetical protein